jgi:hypothetical protein
MKHIFAAIILSATFFLNSEKVNAQFSHQVFDDLLKVHVSDDGKVNYPAFKKDIAKLDKYLSNLKANHPNRSWTKDQRLAYWINAYNAFTIKLILEHMPVKSIMDIHGGKAWDVEWIKLGNNTYSLNYIENKIIRPVFNEPRIHFAVNCAARSCPPLLNEAYKADKLNAQLQQQTIAFIQNAEFNSISPNALKLSKIFEWYAEDFGNITTFIDTYTRLKVSSKAKVSFQEYNWSLNGLNK